MLTVSPKGFFSHNFSVIFKITLKENTTGNLLSERNSCRDRPSAPFARKSVFTDKKKTRHLNHSESKSYGSFTLIYGFLYIYIIGIKNIIYISHTNEKGTLGRADDRFLF